MIPRRTFFKALITSSVAAAFIPNALAFSNKIADSKALPLIKPQRLKSGDTIGLIAPGSNVWEDEDISFAVDILKSFGFKVKKGKHLYQRYGYLAGQDKDRAADVNEMFSDNSIDGIFCLRGGYGSPRILPYLNYELIKKNPKAFVGYSDITALLNAITAKTGLATFHGPIAKQNFTDYTLASFKKVLFNPQSPIELATPPIFETKEGQAEEDNRISIISEGKATGALIGGNLSLMVKLVGTPYEPDYSGKILFLEEVEEAPYRVDGMLTHQWLAGKFDKVAGIVFGKCSDCEASSGPSLSIEQVLRDRLADLNIPVIRGLMIGHIDDMATLPLGAIATLDTATQKLTLEQTAVK
jgi:muramoyltetrapeptide carboxypeptidase